MNYYIDFDHTMYDTSELTKRMLQSIVESILAQKPDLEEKLLSKECISMFNRENIYDIYELVQYFSKKYCLQKEPIINNLNHTILGCNDLVFSDVIPFLKKIKSQKNKVYILSYCKENLQYQSIKIAGSNLSQYFDGLYIVSKPKYELDLNYANGIFIDDNPKNLLGLYSKNPKQVIRIRREKNKYSVKELGNDDIKEYMSFNDIQIF